jgi:hypothetical protein
MVRDKKGRFVKGVSGNPRGRLPKSREQRYLDILVATVTEQDWQQIITRAIADAKKGDTAARKWLADYIIGPPVERKEISGAGAGPIIFDVVYGK